MHTSFVWFSNISMNLFRFYKLLYYSNLIAFLCMLMACNNKGNTKLPIGSFAETASKFSSINIYFESNNYKMGLQKMDSIFQTLEQPTQLDFIFYYNTKSSYSGSENLYFKQIQFADSAIDIINKGNTEKLFALNLVESFILKANGNYSLHKIDEAYNSIFKGFSIALQYGNNLSNASISYDIAMKMYQQQLYDSAIVYFKYAYKYNLISNIEIPHKNNKTQELLDNIGLCFTKLNKTDSALKYYKSCEAFLNQPNLRLALEEANHKARILAAKGVLKGNMAKVYWLKGNADSAILLYKQAIKFNDRPDGDLHDLQTCIIQLNNIYITQNNYQELSPLIALFNKWLKVYNPLKHQMEGKRMEYLLSDYQKQSVVALQNLKQYIVLKDSVEKQEAIFKKNDITKELKEREQQYEISLLTKNNQLSKIYNWVFIALSVVAVIILSLVYINYKKEKKNIKQLALLNTSISQQKTDLELVNTELNQVNHQKEKLMNIMAHELRSPISGITAVAKTLKESEHLNSDDAELINMIEQTSSNTLSLINQLLEEKNNQQLQLHKSEIPINHFLQQIVALQQFKANEKQQIIIEHYAPSLPLIYADKEKLERVVNNLITNAFKFSAPKSNITISSLQQHNFLEIKVQDNGIGMNEAQLQNLFNNPQSLKRLGTMGEKSFGFGLGICKQIIEAHQGQLLVQSQENVGTTFTIQLHLANV